MPSWARMRLASTRSRRTSSRDWFMQQPMLSSRVPLGVDWTPGRGHLRTESTVAYQLRWAGCRLLIHVPLISIRALRGEPVCHRGERRERADGPDDDDFHDHHAFDLHDNHHDSDHPRVGYGRLHAA